MIQEKYNIKLDEIEKISGDIGDYIQKLLAFCSDDDPEVRFRSIEALICIRHYDANEQVYKSLEDPDELVRTTCLEILGEWKDASMAARIIERLDDPSKLVRTAAAIALADIGAEDAKDEIKKRLFKEDDEAKASFYFALCRLGCEEYFTLFLNCFFHDFYRIRCVAANLVGDLVTESNKEFILNLLMQLISKEDSEAAKSSIQNAIKLLTQLFDTKQ